MELASKCCHGSFDVFRPLRMKSVNFQSCPWATMPRCPLGITKASLFTQNINAECMQLRKVTGHLRQDSPGFFILSLLFNTCTTQIDFSLGLSLHALQDLKINLNHQMRFKINGKKVRIDMFSSILCQASLHWNCGGNYSPWVNGKVWILALGSLSLSGKVHWSEWTFQAAGIILPRGHQDGCCVSDHNITFPRNTLSC